MKKIINILIISLLIIPITVLAKGNISVSTKNITLEVGGSATFKVSASNAVGRVDISSSDTSIATVSKSSEFLDNSSVSVKVSAKKVGTTTIKVKLSDAATYDEETLSGTYAINVTVKEKSAATTKKTTTTTKKTEDTPKDINNNLSNLCIKGYTCTKDNDNTYKIAVPNDTNLVVIEATPESNKSTITGTGEKQLTDGTNKFTITVTNENGETKEYTLEVIKEQTKEETNNTKEEINYYKIISIVELAIIVILLTYIIINKKK